jgi:transposase
MESYVGLDVSLRRTSICVVDQTGKVLCEGTVNSTPEAIVEYVKSKAAGAVRIGLETGPTSTRLWTEIKAHGLPVICIDARHAKAVLKMQINKSDRNDAFGIVLQRSPPLSPVAPPDSQAAADESDSDIAERLERLDSGQLLHVAEALGRRNVDANDNALRQSIASWVDEWADDTAEDWADDDLEAARAAGREEAIGLIEEELGLLAPDGDDAPAAP